MSRKFESFERTNSIREANGSFDSCNTCKRLVHSRLHELHEFKLPFVSRIEFIRSELSNCSALYPGSVIAQQLSEIHSCTHDRYLHLLKQIISSQVLKSFLKFNLTDNH